MKTTETKTWLTTTDLANLIGQNRQTIHKHHCISGTYYGVKPAKLPNGRLLWPAAGIEALIGSATE